MERRTVLRGIAGLPLVGGVAGLPATASSAATYDPALALINRWNDLSEQAKTVAEHEFEWFYDTHLTPIEKQVQDSVPAATTAEGAIAALRKVLWFDDLEDQDANLVRSALAYLEGRA